MFRSKTRRMKVVDHLRQFGPATGSQIHRFYFEDCTKDNRVKHLKKLEDDGIVSKIAIRSLLKMRSGEEETPLLSDVLDNKGVSKYSKLPDTFSFVETGSNEWVYFISRQYSFLMHDYNEKNSLSFLGHQLISNDIFSFLKSYFPKESIQSDSQVLGVNGYNRTLLGPIPDLIINSNDKRIAVEVELTLKKSSRYQKKAERYSYSDFDHILYFCASDSVAFSLSQQFKSVTKLHFSILSNKQNFFRFGEESITPRKLFSKIGAFSNGNEQTA